MSREQTVNRQHGLSLIELMVAMMISLFIVAGATMMILPVNRTTGSTARASKMNTDARAVFDLMANELRRAGYQAPSADGPYVVIRNSNICIVYGYAENSGAAVLWNAFRYDSATQRLQAVYNQNTSINDCFAAGIPWMPLTDPHTLAVTSFSAHCQSSGATIQVSMRFAAKDQHQIPAAPLLIQPRNTTCGTP